MDTESFAPNVKSAGEKKDERWNMMRTIDGDALKIALDTFATLVGFGGVYDRGQVMECIDAAPTVGGWISVKDKLPKQNGLYLVYDGEYIGSAEYEKGRMDSEWTDDYEGYLDLKVTHWMPLPEPPKEENA